MPNEETTKIILEFPASSVSIELGTAITFDNISGFLGSDRVAVDGDTLTEKLSAMDGEIAEKADSDDVYDKTYIDNEFTGVNSSLANKMDKSNPTGTGNISVGNSLMNFGTNAQAFGSNHLVTGRNTLVAGEGNEIYSDNTLAFGKYCMPAQNKLEIVGNGTNANSRSNARTLDENGNETLAGDLTFNGGTRLTNEIQRLDGRIDALPEPMVFKGTLGVGGTIQTLPTASTSNEGYTYKVITAGTYAGTIAKVGDVFTSDGSTWVLIPSGDEDSDTWRAIKVNGVEKLGNGISSGSLDVVDTDNIEAEFDNDGNKLKIKTKNIYTQSEVDTLIANAIDSVLPTDSVSKSAVATFETDLAKPIEFKAYIEAVQASGTPTPSIPLPISGWSQAEVTQADENMSTVEQITISLGDTYYGGYVTQDKLGHRQLVITYSDLLDMGGLAWANFSAADKIFRATVPNFKLPIDNADRKNGFLCSIYPPSSTVSLNANMTDKSLLRYNGWIVLRDTSYSDYTELASGLSGAKLIYELAEPIIIDLPDGEPINALIGTNNLFADSGDVECSFKCGVAMYVDNHSDGGNRSINLAKSVEEEVKEEPKDEPETRQER